ncbi:MAG: TetR family transcriptional regulator C-terminal domain-containing protein [Cyanobacteria bacterium J06607_15]
MVNLKRTREDILKSVFDTVHSQGFTGTGLTELFRVSGASSGSFYNYFRSKQELGHALIDFEWSELQANILAPASQQGGNAIAQVTWIIDRLEAKQLKSPECSGCILGNFIVDLAEQDPSFRTHLQEIFDLWQKAIADLLRQGKPQLKPDVDPELLAEAILTSLEGAMLMGRLYRNPARIRRGFDLVRNLLKQGVK